MIDWLNTASNYESRFLDAAMVPRLRVAVRVVAEDEYLAHLAKGPPGPSFYRGEKKFPIIIPNPQQWQIGHLAAEVKRQFKNLYNREVGTIKYFSHGYDDCQLHKDLSVYEHLYDEGKARTDSGDQYVVVKAVYTQGGPLRGGSVLPDFDDARDEHRSIPLVPNPSWTDALSKSSKRPAEEDDDTYSGANSFPEVKRQRLDDLDDADSDDQIALSIERRVQMQAADAVPPSSQTVIQDSQSSPRAAPHHLMQEPSLPENGAVSPQPLRNGVFGRALSLAKRSKSDKSSESSADLSLPISRKHLLYDPNHGQNQALLTPPSDASKKNSTGDMKPSFLHSSKRKGSPIQTTSSTLRRSSANQKSVYDMDEPEDIECSLMSPNSRLATSSKLSRSNSGSKSSSILEAKDTPDRFRGTVPNSEVVKLMANNSINQPESLEKLPKQTSNGSREYNNTMDEYGSSQQSDAFRIQKASTAASRLHDDQRTKARSNAGIAKSPTILSLPENNGPPKTVSRPKIDKVDMEDRTASPFLKGMALEKNEAGSKDSPASNSRAKKLAALDRNKRRKRKTYINDTNSTTSILVDTARSQPNTRQSTPMDSPSEQLLEMQASTQKSERHWQSRHSKMEKNEAREIAEQQDNATSEPQESSDLGNQQNILKAPADGQIIPEPFAASIMQEPVLSNAACKSPYARPSPPPGSIGLGFTNSPRRPSTTSSDSAQQGQRKLFESESTSAGLDRSDAVEDSGSSSEIEEDSSDSAAATPSKQTRPRQFQTPYQKVIAQTKATVEPQRTVTPAYAESVINPIVRTESSKDVVIPIGMTAEQYQAILHRLAKDPPKPKKDAKAVQEQKAQAKSALLRRSLSKDSASSVAQSEKPQAMKQTAIAKGEPSKEPKAAVASTGKPKLKRQGAPKELVEEDRSKVTQQLSRSASSPSTTASCLSTVSSSAPVKAIQAIAAPTPITIPSAAEPGKYLQNLKRRLADRSAKSSPVPPTFTPATKPAAKRWQHLDQDSSDDESSSNESDDGEEKSVKVVTAAKPDPSIRTAVLDSDGDMDDESDEDED